MQTLSPQHQNQLLDLAHKSIVHGEQFGCPLPLAVDSLARELTAPGASFVTLKMSQQLRGCLGSLEAHRPLAEDVVQHAYGAAYLDPRFPPVRRDEIPHLQIQISVLSALVHLPIRNEEDLLQKMRPGQDGLLLRSSYGQGTFLPSVWESLPVPKDFLDALKNKAGFGQRWPQDVQAYTYQTWSFEHPPTPPRIS